MFFLERQLFIEKFANNSPLFDYWIQNYVDQDIVE